MPPDNKVLGKNTGPKKKSGTPTLKTIAEISGLAVPTVSRALSNAPDISLSTRQKVQEIADEIGYVPNRAGVRLRTGKTNVISLILATDQDAMDRTARLIYSLGHELRDTRYHLNITPYFPDEDPMKSIRYVVETRSADAVVLNQTKRNDPRVAYLMEKGFPFATHGRTAWSDSHPFFDYDNEEFGKIATEYLIGAGRKKILFLAPPMDQSFAQHMTAGVGNAAKDTDTTIIRMEGITSDDKYTDIQDAFRNYFIAHPDADGIICGSTTATMAAISAAESRGLNVGQEFDIVAKEAIPFLRQFREQIITISEDIGEAGSFLARAAINAIDNADSKPMQRLVAPTSIQRTEKPTTQKDAT